jgi:hypothetical protein
MHVYDPVAQFAKPVIPDESAYLAWMFHESPAATTDIAVLPGVLGCWTLRRTFQVRLESNPAAVARWHGPLRGLATVIHETPKLNG